MEKLQSSSLSQNDKLQGVKLGANFSRQFEFAYATKL